jgi:flagellar export protein FliJ
MAKAFRFRLEGLLRLRSRVEEEAERRHLAAAAREREAERALDTARLERQQAASEALARRQAGLLDLRAVQDEGAWERVLDQRILEAEQALDEASRETPRAREAWLAARRAREIVSRLKEKQHQGWLQDLEHAERVLLDELATQAHARRQDRPETL